MKNQIKKIILSQDKDRCTVYLISGPNLHFDFKKLGMTPAQGLAWLFDEVLGGTNHGQQAA